MKIVKGSTWLRRDFIERLQEKFLSNHVVELDKFVDFNGREQLVQNMLIRKELALAQENDLSRQSEIGRIRELDEHRQATYKDKLRKEEKKLEEKINGYSNL